MPRRASRATLEIPYLPFGAQIEAHDAPEDTVFLAGGWGSGKTWWLVAEALRGCVLNPGRPGAIVSPSFPLQRRTIYRALIDLLPGATRWPSGSDSATRCLGPMVRDWSSRDRVLRLYNGSEIVFGSAEDPGSLEGASYAWACLDEPRLVRHEAWRILNSRVRDPLSRKLRRSIAGVPSMGWLYDEFSRPFPGRRVVRASTADNPHLPEGYVEHLNLSDRMARAFLHGEWVVLEGVVFFNYAEESIVDVEVSSDRPSYGFLDFGGRRPYFGLLQEVDGLGEVVVEEVVSADILESRHARDIAEHLRSLGVVMLDCYCDPAGKARSAQTGLSSFRVYEDAFLSAGVLSGRMAHPVGPIERHIPNGVEALRARLQAHDGTRHLYIARALTEPERTSRYPGGTVGIHGALLGYRYPKNRPANNIPSKDGTHDHPADALRYYVVGRYGVVDAPDIAAMNEGLSSSTGLGYGGGNFGVDLEDF